MVNEKNLYGTDVTEYKGGEFLIHTALSTTDKTELLKRFHGGKIRVKRMWVSMLSDTSTNDQTLSFSHGKSSDEDSIFMVLNNPQGNSYPKPNMIEINLGYRFSAEEKLFAQASGSGTVSMNITILAVEDKN